MRKWMVFLLMAAISIACINNNAVAAIYQKVPGTAIYVTVPENFKLTDQFPGFVDESSMSSILVSTLPQANAAMREIFTDTKKFSTEMQRQNYLIHDRFDIKTTDGFDATVYAGVQKTGDKTYNKWSTMLFLPGVTYVITVQTPQPNNLSNEQVRDMLQSIRLSQQNDVEEQVETLPFRFQTKAPFQLAGTIMNSSVMLNIPTFGDKENDRPDIVISKGFEDLSAKTPAEILDIYVASLKGTVDDIKKQTVQPTTFAGQSGLHVTAIGKTKNGHVDIVIFVAKAKDGTAMILHATGKENLLQKYQQQIDKIAGSVALIEKTAP